jgi:anti-sigma factor RsiW
VFGQWSIVASVLGHIEAKDRGEVFAIEKLSGGWCLLGQGSGLARVGDQLLLVHRAQAEQQFGLVIEPRADAIPSGVTSKSANEDHLKTGQRA